MEEALDCESGSSTGLSGGTRKNHLGDLFVFLSGKDAVYNGVIREKMRIFTGSK